MTLEPNAPIKSQLLARSEEQRLLDIAITIPAKRVAAISTGRGQAAFAYALENASAEVNLWYWDGYLFQLAKDEAAERQDRPLDRVKMLCQSDWPEGEIELALIPLSMRGEAEMTRELVQSGYDSLCLGGRLVVSVNNPKDRWVHDLLKTYEKSVKVRAFSDATVYIIEKSAPLRKKKEYLCSLSFRDCDTSIEFVTRPGVFSHRELDGGARQLLDAVDVFPEATLLEIGCGAGAVSLALAARDPSATIHAIDSNARAIWCTQYGKRLNGFENLVVAQNHDGNYELPDRFDMVLANPPYFADFRIAIHFMKTALRSLRPGGRVVAVSKQPKWYEENLPEMFNDVEVFQSKQYYIASGVKPSPDS